MLPVWLVRANNNTILSISCLYPSPLCFSERDYGTLECTASNQLGAAVQPCVFTILLAGRDRRETGIIPPQKVPTSPRGVKSQELLLPQQGEQNYFW